MKNRKNKSRMQIPNKKRRFDFAHRSCTYKKNKPLRIPERSLHRLPERSRRGHIPIKDPRIAPAILVAKVTPPKAF